MFLTSLSLFLFSTNCAIALTCRNDYSGTSGCAGNQNAAGNCETLGYYTDDVENCGHYIYCPFDTSYKRCTSFKNTTSCADGYAKDVADCGIVGGWVLGNKDSSGCGKCTKNNCPGNSSTEINSEQDCDKIYGVGRHYGYYSNIEGYSGDKECHLCGGVQTCDELGFVDAANSGPSCEEVSVLGFDQEMMTCYDCEDCGQGYVLVKGECKPSYESCDDAGLLPYPFEYGDYDCKEVSIWSPDGTEVTCYDCDSSSSGGTSLDDCIEVCQDNCKMYDNEEDCMGYDECVKDCQRRYG